MSPTPTTRRKALLAGVALASLLAVPAWADGGATRNVDANGLMLRGYDPVAYFTLGEATPGSPDLAAEHEGAVYHFASAEHRDRFLADPTAYAPAYGGFCALGTAMGRKFDGDPEIWAVVDGRLYVNVHQGAQQRWQGNPAGYIATADHNWPLIRDVPDATLEASPPAGLRSGAS